MKILVACEYSQVVTNAFREKGHEAYSCDILPTEGNKDWHFQCDVREILYDDWNMLIAFPDCTYLTNSGVRWLHTDPSRWEKLDLACEFFNLFLDHPCDKIVIENPIPHKYAVQKLRRNYDQLVQPHFFAPCNESKATALWLKGLPKLERNQWLAKDQIVQRVWKMPPGPNRAKERARFPKEFAEEMARKWSV